MAGRRCPRCGIHWHCFQRGDCSVEMLRAMRRRIRMGRICESCREDEVLSAIESGSLASGGGLSSLGMGIAGMVGGAAEIGLMSSRTRPQNLGSLPYSVRMDLPCGPTLASSTSGRSQGGRLSSFLKRTAARFGKFLVSGCESVHEG